MSVEAMAICLHHSKAATPLARLVLLGIANHDGDGGSWPSVSTLARYAGVTERSVQRAIRELEAAGEIRTKANEGGLRGVRSDRRPNLYEILVSCPPECDGSKHHRLRGDVDVTSSGGNGVTSESERGDAGVADGVTQVSPEPSLEPSVNTEPKPLLDPPDQAAGEPTVDQRAKAISDRYWQWWIDGHGGEKPLTPFMGVRRVVVDCIEAGWPESEIKRCLVACGGSVSRAAMQRARERRHSNVRVTDPTKAAMDDGSFGLPENLRPAPGKSRILTPDEVRAFAIGSSDGKP